METVYKFISPETVYAIGIMLIHFMWQALALAIFLGVFMLFTRKSSPVPRYYAAVFSIFLLPFMALYTFINAFRSIEVAMIAHPEYLTDSSKLLSSQSLLDKFYSIYAAYVPIIVFLWFIGITALLLKNLGGLIIVQRLKNYYIEPASESIKNSIQLIKQNFFISKPISSFISLKATTPLVIGHFKPVVLIPKMLEQSLSDEEMKIVLQHELAHIKRNDFLINICQLVIESLFFFHPATWWISHLARQEREECCDAFAAKTGDEKVILAKALTSIQEYKLKSNTMAVAFLNKKSGLYSRIKSLFGNRPSVPSFREGVFVMLFVFASLFIMSFVVADKTNVNERKLWKTINTELPNGDFMFAKTDSVGSIKDLYINGEKVRKSKFSYYQSKVDSLQVFEHKSFNPKMNFTFDGNLDSSDLEDFNEAMKNNCGTLPSFKLKANEKNSQVDMSADKNGFKMNVNDGKDQVKMNFDEKGAYMDIKQNGKTTFHMSFSNDNFEMTVDSTHNQEDKSKDESE